MAEKTLSDIRNNLETERKSILEDSIRAKRERAEAQIIDYRKRQQERNREKETPGSYSTIEKQKPLKIKLLNSGVISHSENLVVHGDSTGEPFLAGARVLYEDNLPGVVRVMHSIGVKNDIIPEGIYYTVELDDGSIAIATPKSIRALRNDIMLQSIPALEDNINPISGESYEQEYMNTIFKKRKELPMFKKKEEIQKLVNYDFKRIHEQIILIKGETGSGKTTQIPQFFVSDPRYVKKAKRDDKGKRIIVTVPKRLAARSTAKRVADELEVTLGQEVGYSVQNDIKKSNKTRIEFMTEGMLLMEMKNDPLLSRTSMIILDEVHERTVNLDLLIGLLTKLVYSKSRPELKCIFMSATLDEEKFIKYFQKQMDRPSWAPPYLEVEGRSHPVEVFYSREPVSDYIHVALEIILYIHKTKSEFNNEGILVFLPGKKDIEDAYQKLKDLCYVQNINDLVVYPFYSNLSKPEQDKVTEVHDGETSRRVIISTNYAEASVTINGIVYVIDSGMMKKSDYDPKLKLSSLLPGVIDKAAAEQRKGRAGRTQDGYCYRLWTKKDYTPPTFEDTMTPPICTEDISQYVLTLINMGENPIQFGWMDSPSKEQFERACENLTDLGAITNVSQLSKEELPKFGEITQLGKEMAQLPIKPEYAKILLKSPKYKCSKDALSLVACLYNGKIFKSGVPSEERNKASEKKSLFTQPGSEHLTLLTAYKCYINMKKAINRFPTESSEEELQSQKKELQDWCEEYYLNIEALIEIDKMRNKLKRIMESILDDRVENSKEMSSTEIDNLPLPEKLKKLGLKEFIIKRDGNCQFRAVSHQWYGNQEQHEEIRINASIQLLENPDIYKGFVWDPKNNFIQDNDGKGELVTNEYYNNWVSNMTKDSVYGDHVTLQAIADSYGMNIKVISEFINDRFFETNKNSTQARTITVIHKSEDNGIHYNSVEPIPGFVVNNNLIKKSIEEKDQFDTIAQYDMYSNLKKCILEGCFAQVAYYNRRHDFNYIIVKDHTKATIMKGALGFDPKKSRWVCFDKYSKTSDVDYIFTCTVIDNPADLLKIAPEYYNIHKYPKRGIIFDELKKLENLENSEKYATDKIEVKSESDEKLKKENLLKFNIKQDQNCQFAALSQQIYGDDTAQIQIRGDICGEIIRNQKFYSELYPSKDLNKYFTNNNDAGYDCDINIWGDNLTLRAAANFYNRIICVLYFDDKGEIFHKDYIPTDIDAEYFTSLEKIYLLRENKNNYYPIIRIENNDSYKEDNDTVSYNPEEGSIESQIDYLDWRPDEDVFTKEFPHTNSYDAGPL